MTLVSDAVYFCRKGWAGCVCKRGGGTYCLSDRRAPRPPFTFPSCRSLLWLIHRRRSAVFWSTLAVIKTEHADKFQMNGWRREWKHTLGTAHPCFRMHACMCVCVERGCARALGGALSRYQVVFPSAPERALIVLLFNLLVILDARQEPFTQT